MASCSADRASGFFQRSPSAFSSSPPAWTQLRMRQATSARTLSASADGSLPTSSRAWSFWLRSSQARASIMRRWSCSSLGKTVVREVLSASIAASGLRSIR